MTPDTLLPVPVVAARLGVSATAVYQLVRRGRLPASKPGGRDLLIAAADLAAYEARRRPAGFQRGNAAWRQRAPAGRPRQTPPAEVAAPSSDARP